MSSRWCQCCLLKNNPSQFIWQSNRDGWNHLYLYRHQRKIIKAAYKRQWEVTDVKGFDAKGENLFYIHEESPITRNLYRLNMKTGIVKTHHSWDLVYHYYAGKYERKYVIDNFSS